MVHFCQAQQSTIPSLGCHVWAQMMLSEHYNGNVSMCIATFSCEQRDV